jgi:anti-anti-sigma regulatory factor
VTVRLDGDLDKDTITAVRAEFARAVSPSTTAIVLDLTGVSFPSLEAVGMLPQMAVLAWACQRLTSSSPLGGRPACSTTSRTHPTLNGSGGEDRRVTYSAVMRLPGVVDSARGLGARSHLCWRYEDHSEFVVRAQEFLSDGLAAGERACCIAPGDVAVLTGQLRELDGLDEAIDRGALRVESLDTLYPVGTTIDPAIQIRTYAAATRDALAAGFTGLRVAAEATDLVRTPAQLDSFTRYEHLVDQFMLTQPFTALCAYHRSELGDQVVAQLACVHPQANTGATPFRLHTRTTQDQSTLALGGELDLTGHDLLSRALDRVAPRPVEGRILIDATDLSFIDHRGMLALDDYAGRRGVTAVLRTSLSTPDRLITILDLTNVCVERMA